MTGGLVRPPGRGICVEKKDTILILAGVGICFLLVLIILLLQQAQGQQPPQRYVVRPHDTVWSIAASRRREDQDVREAVWEIERWNHLRQDVIQPGQVLLVP
jgi:hypothetical protein